MLNETFYVIFKQCVNLGNDNLQNCTKRLSYMVTLVN